MSDLNYVGTCVQCGYKAKGGDVVAVTEDLAMHIKASHPEWADKIMGGALLSTASVSVRAQL